MNTLKIEVTIDQKAALLAGHITGPTAQIEVSPESIGDQWPALVAALRTNTTPPSLPSSLLVTIPTAEGIRAALLHDAELQRLDAECIAAALEARDAAAEAAAAEAETIVESGPIVVQNTRWATKYELAAMGYGPERSVYVPSASRRLPSLSAYFDVRLPHRDTSRSICDNTPRFAAAVARLEAATAKNNALMLAEDARLFAEKLPELIEVRVADEQRAAAEEAAKKAANSAKYAERLSSGMWTMDTGSYNERRYGAWWCASVDFSSGAKGDYTFGESSGTWGKAGTLSIECHPGDFIAYGQKDQRKGGGSHNLLRMRADGSMESFADKADAYRAHRASQKSTA